MVRVDRGEDRGTGVGVYYRGGRGRGIRVTVGGSSKVGCIYIDRYEENHGTYDRVKLHSE